MQVYKAAKYIRLSYTDDKSNESNSVGNQRKLIEDFVSRSEKVDDGYSGVIFDRPAFKEMMDDIMEGKINCVIVKDLSRLGREYIETGRYMRRVFPAYGVRFIAINDGSVTEEMPDQKRIIFEHRAVICRQEKSWLAGNRSFLFLPLLAEAETMQCKEVV